MSNPINPGSTNPQSNVNNLYSQYQNAVQQLQLYEEQENQITGLINELNLNLKTIKGLDDYPDDSEIILPLGGMVMLRANLSGIKELLVNIGSDVVVPTSLDEAEQILKKRVEEMNNLVKKLRSDKQQLENIVSSLQAQLNQFNQ